MGPTSLDPAQMIMAYVTLVFSLCVHEAAHAAMANYCGDPTARLMGRLTLDPRKHLDPIGTVLLPILNLFTGMVPFGWAKPVPFNPRNLGNIRRDQVLIAIAGPLSNLLIALASVFVLRILFLIDSNPLEGTALYQAVFFLFKLMFLNIVLAVFNMLPVPPLDGHYLVRYFVSYRAAAMLDRIGPFGIVIAFMLAGPWLALALRPVQSLFFALLTYGT